MFMVRISIRHGRRWLKWIHSSHIQIFNVLFDKNPLYFETLDVSYQHTKFKYTFKNKYLVGDVCTCQNLEVKSLVFLMWEWNFKNVCWESSCILMLKIYLYHIKLSFILWTIILKWKMYQIVLLKFVILYIALFCMHCTAPYAEQKSRAAH